jgi:archaellum biogenesis ATPase FlaH
VLELPDLPEKGDVLDYLDAGGTVDQLLALVEQTPPYDPASFRISESYMLGGSEETLQIRIIPSTEVPPPEEGSGLGLLEPIVPDPPALVLLSGESSAGKTVLAYNLAYHLAEGLEIAGLTPQRPVRVLYCDLENPDSVHRSLVDIIGRSDNLAFIRVFPNTLKTDEGRNQFLEGCYNFRPDVVILDPLTVAWPVDDENDNAKADRQMWGLKEMTMALNCVFICLWNMGEGNVKDKFRARGATARIDRSDLALNYLELTENTRQLKVVKSRYGTLGMSLTLRFAAEMGLEAVDASDNTSIPSEIASFQQRIRELTESYQMSRQEIINVLGNEDLVDKAVNRIVQAGELRRVKRGVYEGNVSSESPNHRGSDSEETLAEDEGEV